MGDNADCDRCGCVVPFHMATLSSRRLMLKEGMKSLLASKNPSAPHSNNHRLGDEKTDPRDQEV
jgi:hypothetical protein